MEKEEKTISKEEQQETNKTLNEEAHQEENKKHKEEKHQTKEHKKCCKDEMKSAKKELEEALKTIEHLTKEADEAKSKMMMAQAEMVNFRKRKEEETSNMLKYANQDLILEVIGVLDNFERALNLDDNNLNDELSKFLVGFKMIYASLKEILIKFGVEEIDALDKDFDPMVHQALLVDQDKEKPNNIVLDVLLKGYKLKDRVIRPASVKVNKLD